ncbi:hypothetical protein AGMMS49992_18680 [Clostridia bacterium]|nr:hypothetical protein AGMMS49992_18680 [Clostridia bacterium]
MIKDNNTPLFDQFAEGLIVGHATTPGHDAIQPDIKTLRNIQALQRERLWALCEGESKPRTGEPVSWRHLGLTVGTITACILPLCALDFGRPRNPSFTMTIDLFWDAFETLWRLMCSLDGDYSATDFAMLSIACCSEYMRQVVYNSDDKEVKFMTDSAFCTESSSFRRFMRPEQPYINYLDHWLGRIRPSGITKDNPYYHTELSKYLASIFNGMSYSEELCAIIKRLYDKNTECVAGSRLIHDKTSDELHGLLGKPLCSLCNALDQGIPETKPELGDGTPEESPLKR